MVKRVLDLVLGALALAALWPWMLLLALWVRMHDGGPALFRQQRVGHKGAPFELWKLRTMHIGAHAEQAKLAHQNEVVGPAFRMRNDPRVTGPGRFLRRTGLDELPQLVNVIRGEMSLVGPRPPLPEEVARYKPGQHRRFDVLPGITGMWQVRGRHLTSVDAWIALDLDYVDHCGPWLDLQLLLQTPLAVMRGWERAR